MRAGRFDWQGGCYFGLLLFSSGCRNLARVFRPLFHGLRSIGPQWLEQLDTGDSS